jgi:uncharacterized phage protein gp47/JayE
MGYDLNGFTPKTLTEIADSMRASVRGDTDPTLILDDLDPVGRLLVAGANEIAQAWEVAQEAFSQLDPNNAEGATLSGVTQLTGTSRLSATATRVQATCTLTVGTVLLPGVAKAYPSGRPTVQFTPDASLYPAGFTAPSTGTHLVWFVAEQPGKVEVLAGQLVTITVPVAGWSAVTNVADGVTGDDEESDEALALRQQEELEAVGSGYVDAIADDVQEYVRTFYQSGSASCLENVSDLVVDGMDPHSIEVIVYDGPAPFTAQDQAIAEVLFRTKGAGIKTNGPIVKTVLGRENISHEVRFRRATIRQVHFNLVATYDPAVLTTPDQVTATVAAIKAAIVAKGVARRKTGLDVTRSAYFPVLANTPGVVEVTRYSHALDGAAPLSDVSTSLTIPRREIANVNSANVLVSLVAAGEL